MALFRITVKQKVRTNGIVLDPGMQVEVVTQSYSDPVHTNGGQVVVDAFMRIYGVDIKKAGALNGIYLDVKRIGYIWMLNELDSRNTMGKVMWFRCPDCGRWLVAEKKNFWGRIERHFGMDDGISDSLGELGDYIGIKPVLKVISKPIDWYTKIFYCPFEAIAGDDYKFCCSCGKEFGTNDESIDQSEGHELCLQIDELLKQYSSRKAGHSLTSR